MSDGECREMKRALPHLIPEMVYSGEQGTDNSLRSSINMYFDNDWEMDSLKR